MVLITADADQREGEDISKEKPDWLPERQWSDLIEASKGVGSLNGLLEHFLSNLEQWKDFYDSTASTSDVPEDWKHLR